MIRFLAASIFLLISFRAFSQSQPASNDINIVQAERLNIQKIGSIELNSLAGNVIVKQGNTIFYCDSAVLNKTNNVLEAFGKVHINDNDSVHTYSDYLRYEGNSKMAFLKNNVRLTDNKSTLTTSELTYDVNTKIGTYYNGGTVTNGATVLTSRQGIYSGNSRDILFKHQVILTDPEYNLQADSLLYNSYTNIANFITLTTIKSKDQLVKTSKGYYDLTHKKAVFSNRPEIHDGSTILIADDVVNDDASGFGEANGNVFLKDTAQGFSMYAGNIKTNRKISGILATENPVMAIKQENNDSLFIGADTLYSASLTHLKKFRKVPYIRDSSLYKGKDLAEDSSVNRFFEAYYNVKIFSDSLQSVSDSMFYSGEDSIFRLFKSPIVWSKNNQLTGDTIYLYTKNKQPEFLDVFENAMAISDVNNHNLYYNQIKSKTIKGFFTDGVIDTLKASGNAESIYYIEDDDKKLVAVNKSTCRRIEVSFGNQEPQKVSLLFDVKGVSHPIRMVNHEEMRLRGFKWYNEARPKSKFELKGFKYGK